MKKKILFLVTVLAFMVAMPIASAEVLEAKDVTTLVEMVKKAKDGDTVKLTADITSYDQKLEINGKRTITLDMNGHNITYLTDSKSYIGVYGATLIVKGSGVITNDTDSGLNVYGKETKDDSFVSKLIVEKDVTLKGKYGLAIFWDTKNGSHGASVDFYGKVDVTNNGIATNGDILNEDGPVVNIKKGAVVKSTGADGVAVYCAGNGTYNIEDGATITGATGIEVRAGKLNVKGGTITGTAKELTSKANGGGSTTAGAGIAVVQHTTQLPIEVNITGGTITGAEALYVNNTQGNPTTAWAKVNITVAGGTFNTDVTKFLGDKYVVNKNGNTYAVVENKVLETTDEKVVFESAEAIRNDLVLKVTEKTEDEIKKGTEKVTEAYKDNKKVKEVKLINLYEINVLNGAGRVEKLEDGKFTIAIAIPESEQKYDAYKVVYFDEEGKLVETLDAKLENGKVVFTTTHLSTYGVVGYNNVVTKNPATNDMNLALILASLGLASAGAVLVSRKKLAKANR